MEESYQRMLAVCKEADHQLENLAAFTIEDKQIVFQTKKMLAYLHLKDYNNGKINAEQCLNKYRKGSVIWFDFMEYYLLLALHTDRYIHAIAIFNEAYYNPNLKKLSYRDREKWSIYEAYLFYLSHFLKDDQPLLKRQFKKRFALSSFLKNEPSHPREERIFTYSHLNFTNLNFN